MKYKVVLQRSEEGVAANVPGLPGCWSQGADDQEALENIKVAVQEYLAGLREPGHPGGPLGAGPPSTGVIH